MGWKSVKTHYGINHTVHVCPAGKMWVGSAYISELIEITPQGAKPKDGFCSSGELRRIIDAMNADTARLAELIAAADEFDRPKPVWTIGFGSGVTTVREDMYEGEFGWPNVTVGGTLMYENTAFEDRAAAARYAAESNRGWAKELARRAVRLRAEADEAEMESKRYEAAAACFDVEVPHASD